VIGQKTGGKNAPELLAALEGADLVLLLPPEWVAARARSGQPISPKSQGVRRPSPLASSHRSASGAQAQKQGGGRHCQAAEHVDNRSSSPNDRLRDAIAWFSASARAFRAADDVLRQGVERHQ